MSDIVVLLSHVPNPRMNKRIIELKKYGEVSVVCVRRTAQNIWEPVFEDIDYYIIEMDFPSLKKPVRRLKATMSYYRKVRKLLHRLKPTLIYTAGLDSLRIATKYKKQHNVEIFYEVADVREIYIKEPRHLLEAFVQRTIIGLEKKHVSKVYSLVVTSEKFYDIFYSQFISKSKVIYIPNIPDLKAFQSYTKKHTGDFTIGFIGALRYLDQMEMLIDVAAETDTKVVFAGSGENDFKTNKFIERCNMEAHVTYKGKYDYDTDIADLYGEMDCIYAVYDVSNPNVRIALPNKFYESMYCELPIIVSSGTYLGELTESLGTGIAINYQDKNELYNILDILKKRSDTYDEIVLACNKQKQKFSLESYNAQFNDVLKKALLISE